MVELEHFHTKEWREVLENLNSSEYGLSEAEVKKRLFQYGKNRLSEVSPPTLFSIFLSQFKSPLIYVLLLAAGALLFLNENIDAGIIFFVLFFNAALGTVQEGRAQRTLLAIKKFAETNATIIREGKEIVIPDTFVVPGDIIFLQEGEKVPADGRIFASNGLLVDESALTGESTPVTKISDRLPRLDTALTDRRNMVFKGTNILSGNGKMVVTATGVKTFIGDITEKISEVDTEIPLRGDIRRLSQIIIGLVVFLCIALFSFGFFYGRSPVEMFKIVIALAVSIIPSGLPIVITLVLATGVWRMSKRNVLIKKLQAVEALGQAHVIAVDKTGTITKNELVVERIFTGKQDFMISGVGYEPKGELMLGKERVEPLNHHDVIVAAKISALIPNAHLSYIDESKSWRVSGDPTEAAMLVFAEKMGFNREILEEEAPRIFEIPFDYREKYHVIVTKEKKGKMNTYVAGAPEAILSRVSSFLRNEHHEKLDTETREILQKMFVKYASDGLRVIALAYESGDHSDSFKEGRVDNLTFVAFLAMRDAPRAEVAGAVEEARSAGIKVVMITGDHKESARAVARQAGIYKSGDEVLTGDDINKLGEGELPGRLENASVFARVNPEHKLKIIEAYKHRGEIIAMTGDGVNDAPSLVAADLGIAMGKIGTEVAKEASDIVIMDDNFSSIVAGIEEGRNIYRTIKKVILYLFSTSLGEVLVISSALFFGLPLPLLASQIIWLNLVTDGFLTAALAMDPKEPGLLRGTFKRPGKYLIDGLMARRMANMAIPMALGTLTLFWFYLASGEDLPKALTVSLTTLAIFQWFNAWNCRSERESIGKRLLSNKFLIWATATVIILQIAAVYTPFLQKVLRTVPLNTSDFAIMAIVSTSIIVFEEIRKFFYRRSHQVDVLPIKSC